MSQQIVDTARAHLASHGAAGLSLRAVARDVGLVSSAVYRYVPSRDDLLTRLITDAYDALGEAAEDAESTVPRGDLVGRFRVVAQAVRRWALTHEHEYALIFGSPVPGYRAPQSTVEPATRVPRLLVGIIGDALATGRVEADLPAPSQGVLAAIAPVRALFDGSGAPVPPELVVRGLMAWTYLFGAVSFDLFGHRHAVLADERALDSPFFAAEVERMIGWIGLVDAAAESSPRPRGAAGVDGSGLPPAPVTVVEGRAWR
jgi:AcrR family transcriptional regulator